MQTYCMVLLEVAVANGYRAIQQPFKVAFNSGGIVSIKFKKNEIDRFSGTKKSKQLVLIPGLHPRPFIEHSS